MNPSTVWKECARECIAFATTLVTWVLLPFLRETSFALGEGQLGLGRKKPYMLVNKELDSFKGGVSKLKDKQIVSERTRQITASLKYT